jgi:hypothetical protein
MNGEPPYFERRPEKPSSGLFWTLLMAPTFLAIISGLCATRGPSDFGALVGWLAFFVGLVSSVYCSRWLARRFAKPGAARVALGAVIFLAIGIINLIVAIAGCSGNVSFH